MPCRSTRRTGCSRAGSATIGDDTARAIAIAHGHEPPLDLTVKSDAESWAQRLRGRVLPTGTRAHDHAGPGRAAARLRRRRLVGAGRRRRAAGAPARRRRRQARSPTSARRPAARPRSWRWPARGSPRSTARPAASRACARISRGSACRPRLVAADAAEWQGGPFDAVLVDAPCSSTGTIRRHPDVAWLKREADIAQLAGVQRRLLDRAVALIEARRPAASTASARSSPRKASSRSRPCWRASRALRRVPIERRRNRRRRRFRQRRPATCARCRCAAWA